MSINNEQFYAILDMVEQPTDPIDDKYIKFGLTEYYKIIEKSDSPEQLLKKIGQNQIIAIVTREDCNNILGTFYAINIDGETQVLKKKEHNSLG